MAAFHGTSAGKILTLQISSFPRGLAPLLPSSPDRLLPPPASPLCLVTHCPSLQDTTTQGLAKASVTQRHHYTSPSKTVNPGMWYRSDPLWWNPKDQAGWPVALNEEHDHPFVFHLLYTLFYMLNICEEGPWYSICSSSLITNSHGDRWYVCLDICTVYCCNR